MYHVVYLYGDALLMVCMAFVLCNRITNVLVAKNKTMPVLAVELSASVSMSLQIIEVIINLRVLSVGVKEGQTII